MKLKPYAEYKDSGVEWLGTIPVHWDLKKLKYVASLQSGESITSEEITDDGPFPVFGGNGLRGYTAKYSHEGHFALIGRQGALCGNINFARGRFWASEHAIVVTNNGTSDTKWLGELLGMMNLNQYSVSAAQPGLSVDALNNLSIPVPSIDEQLLTASFLHRETAKIDTLISEQQDLIALLREKRQAVISHAVTKGLNPDVPMKDSGIEWLGLIPEPWSVKALRHLIHGIDQGWSPQAEDREADLEEWAVIKLSAIKAGRFFDAEHKTLPAGINIPDELEIRPGDLLLTRSNTPELVGDVCVVNATRPRLLFSDLVFRPRLIPERIDARFLMYFLLSGCGRTQIRCDARGSSQSMVKISQGLVYAWMIPTPSLVEQQTIARFLDQELRIFDRLIAEAESTITLLQEHRTALISAVVTGKVDVRDYATNPEAATLEVAR